MNNILSRAFIVNEVSARLLAFPGDTPAAIAHVAERWGVLVETVQECLSIETLESGQ